MDALVKATIESLSKKILPELQEQLLLCLHSGLPLSDVDLLYNLEESRELLNLLLKASLQINDSSSPCIQDSVSTLDSKREDAVHLLETSATLRNVNSSRQSSEELAKNQAGPLSD